MSIGWLSGNAHVFGMIFCGRAPLCGTECLLITQVPLKKTWLWFRLNLCDLLWQLAFTGLVQLKSNFSLCLHDPEKTHFLLLQVEDVQALPGFLLSLSCFLLLVSHLPGSRGME